MIQETKNGRPNQLSIEDYDLYEGIRKGKRVGGGILIGMHKDIDCTPVVVSKYEEEIEMLVVEVAFGSMVVRFLTGYGPQEDAPEDVTNKFYSTLEEEIVKCEEENCGLIAELDCNAKLGENIIKGDPNGMSTNGKLLWDVVERRNCTIVNGTEKCTGCITRSRNKAGKMEKSVLDYVFVNAMISPYVSFMIIDESKQNALTRFIKGKFLPSDHNLLSCTFDIPIKKKNLERHEIFNLRNPEELQIFKETTTNTNVFTKCFQGNDNIKVQGKRWMKLLQGAIRRSFKKIRIRRNNKKSEIHEKMKLRKDLLKRIQNTNRTSERFELEDKVKDIEEEISNEYRQKQVQKIQEQLSTISNTNGSVSTSGVWKLRKKLCPKPMEQLTAKMDKECNLVKDLHYLNRTSLPLGLWNNLTVYW